MFAGKTVTIESDWTEETGGTCESRTDIAPESEPVKMDASHSTRYDELKTASSFSPSVINKTPP